MNWIKNYKRYGDITNSHDLLKFVALIIMIIDHIGTYFFPDDAMFKAIGRTGFPVWFFFAGYSAGNTKIFEKELVIGCALLVFIDVVFGKDIFPINALLTMISIRLLVNYFTKKPEFLIGFNFIVINLIFVIFWLPTACLFEYGSTGLAFGLAGFATKNYSHKNLHKYYLSFLTLVFILEEYALRDFNLLQTVIMICGTALISYNLIGYRLINYNFSNNFFQKTIRFLGRNTLYLYVIHICLFVVLEFLINHNYI